jgi:ATP-binding cassette, subfamily B, bacterial
LMERDLVAEAESQSYLVEALGGIATLKASGAEERALDHWLNLFSKHLNVSLERSHLSAAIEAALTGLRNFSPLVLLWVGALYVIDGAMSLGTMLALNALGLSFLTPIASLVASGHNYNWSARTLIESPTSCARSRSRIRKRCGLRRHCQAASN